MDPDHRRMTKQLAYGMFFCFFWAVVIYSSYLLFFKTAPSCFDNKLNQGEVEADCGGPCQSCDIKKLKPVEVLSEQLFTLNGLTALTQLKNPNSLYGLARLPYTIELKAVSGSTLQSITGETFIYPGEVKYIIEELPVMSGVVATKTTLGVTAWKSTKEFPMPNMIFRGVVSKVGDNKNIFVSGVLQNNETLLFPRITINALFYDSFGNMVGISKTKIQDVRAFEERFFQVEHPQVPNLDPAKTDLHFEAKRP